MNGSAQNTTLRRKIYPLHDLSHLLLQHRRQNRRVVLCHGVFDLLHIGHIRHFEQAKRLGDVLVVTVTPDRFVNKGPQRPAFPETLRAEAVAALDCVDYVAINHWPQAMQTIQLLRPAVYVKGAEYRQAENDHTGGIGLEESAVKAVGGELAFTDDITFSSSHLLNRHHPLLQAHVRDYLDQFSRRYSANEVLHYVKAAQGLKVLVVGEAIIDAYQYCEAIGKSSKEPMLALKRLALEKFAGGILAVGNHVANFCNQVTLLTMLGTEPSEEPFIRDKLNRTIKPVFVYRKDSPTIVKRRFIEEHTFTKLLEVYDINDAELDRATNIELCSHLSRVVPEHDVVIVVDFGHGMLSREAVDVLCNKARFLAINAQSNAGNLGYHTISKYPWADYISMAENEIRLEARDRAGNLRDLMLDVSERLKCHRIVVTRSKYGCICYSREQGFFEIPAFAEQVVDRVGAGDAFLSLTALCAAQNVPMEILGFIGNAVGAEAVMAVGHRTSIERIPLLKHIESLLK